MGAAASDEVVEAPADISSFRVGEAVEIYCASRKHWISAVVVETLPHGSLHVDCGTFRKMIPHSQCNSRTIRQAFRVSEAIEVYCASRKHWISSVVVETLPHGSLHVDCGTFRKIIPRPQCTSSTIRKAAIDAPSRKLFLQLGGGKLQLAYKEAIEAPSPRKLFLQFGDGKLQLSYDEVCPLRRTCGSAKAAIDAPSRKLFLQLGGGKLQLAYKEGNAIEAPSPRKLFLQFGDGKLQLSYDEVCPLRRTCGSTKAAIDAPSRKLFLQLSGGKLQLAYEKGNAIEAPSPSKLFLQFGDGKLQLSYEEVCPLRRTCGSAKASPSNIPIISQECRYTLGECVEVRDAFGDWKQRVVTRTNPLLIGGLQWSYVRKVGEVNETVEPQAEEKPTPAVAVEAEACLEMTVKKKARQRGGEKCKVLIYDPDDVDLAWKVSFADGQADWFAINEVAEEDEDEIYSQSSKLYLFVGNEWEATGSGEAKLLKHNDTGQVRCLLRHEKTMKVIGNHLAVGVDLLPKGDEGTCWVWTAEDFADDKMKVGHFALKFDTAKDAIDFKGAFDNANEMNKKVLATAARQRATISEVSANAEKLPLADSTGLRPNPMLQPCHEIPKEILAMPSSGVGKFDLMQDADARMNYKAGNSYEGPHDHKSNPRAECFSRIPSVGTWLGLPPSQSIGTIHSIKTFGTSTVHPFGFNRLPSVGTWLGLGTPHNLSEGSSISICIAPASVQPSGFCIQPSVGTWLTVLPSQSAVAYTPISQCVESSRTKFLSACQPLSVGTWLGVQPSANAGEGNLTCTQRCGFSRLPSVGSWLGLPPSQSAGGSILISRGIAPACVQQSGYSRLPSVGTWLGLPPSQSAAELIPISRSIAPACVQQSGYSRLPSVGTWLGLPPSQNAAELIPISRSIAPASVQPSGYGRIPSVGTWLGLRPTQRAGEGIPISTCMPQVSVQLSGFRKQPSVGTWLIVLPSERAGTSDPTTPRFEPTSLLKLGRALNKDQETASPFLRPNDMVGPEGNSRNCEPCSGGCTLM